MGMLKLSLVWGAVGLVALLFVLEEIRLMLLRRQLDTAVVDTEKRNIQLSYLIKASRTLSSALTKEKILRLIVEAFGDLTKSERSPSVSALFLLDYNTNRFVYETGYNMDVTMLKSPSFGTDEAPFKGLKKNSEVVFFEEKDNATDIFFKEKRKSMFKNIESAIFVPLLVENEAIAVIASFLAKSSFQFLKKDMYLMEALRGETAIAVGSAVQSELAVLDRLTKIYNHAYFETRLEQEVARSDRYQYPVSLLMIDIDHFKRINDTYGHQQGDILLKEVAKVIKNNIRVVDLCARYGGEEFAVIFPETDLAGASKREGVKIREDGGALAKAEHLRAILEKTVLLTPEGLRMKITVSIGIAVKKFPEAADMSKDGLVREADKQLYKAKQEGRNKVCYSSSIAPTL